MKRDKKKGRKEMNERKEPRRVREESYKESEEGQREDIMRRKIKRND